VTFSARRVQRLKNIHARAIDLRRLHARLSSNQARVGQSRSANKPINHPPRNGTALPWSGRR
jgi:hypothetical protein